MKEIWMREGENQLSGCSEFEVISAVGVIFRKTGMLTNYMGKFYKRF
jgi:hypothetical protein